MAEIESQEPQISAADQQALVILHKLGFNNVTALQRALTNHFDGKREVPPINPQLSLSEQMKKFGLGKGLYGLLGTFQREDPEIRKRLAELEINDDNKII